jgi:hypothetical protein
VWDNQPATVQRVSVALTPYFGKTGQVSPKEQGKISSSAKQAFPHLGIYAKIVACPKYTSITEAQSSNPLHALNLRIHKEGLGNFLGFA